MTLQQLRQVLTIAESNSMNEAAKKLFVSQPNLSATVREVEEELGITVFMRNNRGITVTAEGEEFLGYAKQVVEQYHECGVQKEILGFHAALFICSKGLCTAC